MNTFFGSRRGARLGVAAVGFLFLAGILALAFNRTVWAQNGGAVNNAAAESAPAALANATAGLAEMQNGFTAIADHMRPSIVMILVQRTIQANPNMPDLNDLFPGMPGMPGMPSTPRTPGTPRTFRERGAGSGVIVRSDGWILTNDHVAGGADKVTVELSDGRRFEGTVRRDFRSDLALVKINANNLVPAELGDSEKVRVGQWAIAFGSPFELTDTMTLGIVSALHRQSAIGEGSDARYYPSLIQTDAPINPGNSGGPLVDIYGRIIGINVAINSPTGGSVGIGFAIPANTARSVMDQLITRGKVVRGFLGVVPTALTPAQRQRYGVPNGGALVEQVSENTPASKAGLQVEDVVVRYNGQPVTDDIALRNMVANTPPGTKVDMVVHRDGRDQTLTTTIGTLPDEPTAQAQPVAPPTQTTRLGVRVQPVTPDLIRQYNLTGITSGVIVTDVQNGGPADEAGLQAGDVLLRANQRPIRSEADLRAVLSPLKSGDSISLVVQRGDTRTLATVTMP